MLPVWLGTVAYPLACSLQDDLASRRVRGEIGDVLLLLEHPPTITLGRAARPEHVVAGADDLARQGIVVHSTDRGGDVTYHGPGQLVGYPVFALNGPWRDLHAFLRGIEEALLRALRAWGIEGRRLPPLTGVWVGEEKVAAIGIRVSRWVSTHGFALNVAPDMSHFATIVPCGIRGYGVTCLSALLGRPVGVEETVSEVIGAFDSVFAPDSARPLVRCAASDLIGMLQGAPDVQPRSGAAGCTVTEVCDAPATCSGGRRPT